ncbi:unnamed protein product, partial [Rotaria sordida]
MQMFRGRGRGGNRGFVRGRGASRGRGISRGRGHRASRGRGQFISRGGYGGGAQIVRSSSMDIDQQTPSVNFVADLDINADPKPFFINANVTIDQHI